MLKAFILLQILLNEESFDMEKGKSNKSIILKLSILGISIALTSTDAISMIVPSLLGAFPDVSRATVESIITIVSLATFVAVLLNDFVVKVIGYRKTVMLGIILTFIGGIAPSFLNDFNLILGSRIVLGVGLGLCNPLAVTLITLFFKNEDEQSAMLGYQSATSGVGLTIMTFIAGLLSHLGWRYSFSVYLIMIPVLILFYFYVPEPKIEMPDALDAENNGKKAKLNGKVIGLAVLMFIYFVFYITIGIKGASVIIDRNIGSSVDAGNMYSLHSLASVIGGVLFLQIYKVTKKYTLAFTYLLMMATSFIIYFSNSLIVIGIGMFIGGISLAVFIPYIFLLVGKVAPKGAENLGVSSILVASNFGIFVSPYIVNFIPGLIGEDVSTYPFFVGGIVFAISLILSLIYCFISKSEEVEVNEA